VTVCVYIMETNDGNIQNPCGDMFGPMRKPTKIIQNSVFFFCLFVCFSRKFSVKGRFRSRGYNSLYSWLYDNHCVYGNSP